MENRNNYPRRSIARIYNKDELLAEFFGFLPVQFADEVYNAYNYVFYTALESLEQFLQSLDGLNDRDIKDSMQQFEKKVEEVVDANFNIFERYLYDNILMVPKSIDPPMEHYDGLDLSVTEEQEELLDQELEQYRKSVLAYSKRHSTIL
ncbi:Mis12 protein-domain-containing protein [Fennellomyces sp. T-0311]|nr:Mis12 protein-domain-containing protein [Fennellomyces sp. T-0311]